MAIVLNPISQTTLTNYLLFLHVIIWSLVNLKTYLSGLFLLVLFNFRSRFMDGLRNNMNHLSLIFMSLLSFALLKLICWTFLFLFLNDFIDFFAWRSWPRVSLFTLVFGVRKIIIIFFCLHLLLKMFSDQLNNFSSWTSLITTLIFFGDCVESVLHHVLCPDSIEWLGYSGPLGT